MLELKNVVKIFGKNTVNERVALKGVDLTVNENDFVTVIGGNGAGKSTLLNVIAGVFMPEEGSVIIDGKDVTRMPEYKRAAFISRVFQDPMLGTAANMNIEDNLALAYGRGRSRGLSWNISRKDRKFFAEQLEKLNLGLEHRMSQKAMLLSGGQRQALTLLMATILRPRLLLLDEHTAALDPKTAEKVLELTATVTRDQTTIMITHNMRDALRFGNKLIMMNDGNIIFSAEGEEKAKLTVADLMEKFAVSGEATDRVMLS